MFWNSMAASICADVTSGVIDDSRCRGNGAFGLLTVRKQAHILSRSTRRSMIDFRVIHSVTSMRRYCKCRRETIRPFDKVAFMGSAAGDTATRARRTSFGVSSRNESRSSRRMFSGVVLRMRVVMFSLRQPSHGIRRHSFNSERTGIVPPKIYDGSQSH